MNKWYIITEQNNQFNLIINGEVKASASCKNKYKSTKVWETVVSWRSWMQEENVENLTDGIVYIQNLKNNEDEEYYIS